MPIANDLKKYAVNIVTSTRNAPKYIEYGASPRASIGLVVAAKARALLYGRTHVSREDIQAMAFPILRHRIILTFEAEREKLTHDEIIKRLL
ncbi:MAG: MoxR family ATPase [Candidatus Woesearchaeota archaeon]